jgi:hypothetical protein
VNDYESMDDTALNIEVAKRTHTLTTEDRKGRLWWVVRQIGGERMNAVPDIPGKSEGDAWAYFAETHLPKPATDANAALALWKWNIGFNLSILFVAGKDKYTWCVEYPFPLSDKVTYTLTAFSEMPARAITIAWLKYQEKVNGE